MLPELPIIVPGNAAISCEFVLTGVMRTSIEPVTACPWALTSALAGSVNRTALRPVSEPPAAASGSVCAGARCRIRTSSRREAPSGTVTTANCSP